MKQVKKPETWSDIMRFIRDQGFDRDEYFATGVLSSVELQDLIWSENTVNVAAFWMIGGSEGYFVQVVRHFHTDKGYAPRPNSVEVVLLGKFWKWERAEEAAIAIQRFVLGRPQREIE